MIGGLVVDEAVMMTGVGELAGARKTAAQQTEACSSRPSSSRSSNSSDSSMRARKRMLATQPLLFRKLTLPLPTPVFVCPV